MVRHRIARATAFALLLMLTDPILAATVCPVDIQPPAHPGPPPAHPGSQASSTINAVADEAHVDPNSTSVFTGHVEAHYAGQVVLSDKVVYDKPQDAVEASGRVRIIDRSGDTFDTSFSHLDMATRTGYAAAGAFLLGSNHGRGAAAHTTFLSHDRLQMHDVRYTLCTLGRDDWYLVARRLDIDRTTNIGIAHDAHLDFMGVPVLYTPYLRFPTTSARESGLLVPRLGPSSNLGFIFAQPYYFNIAPNFDDTLTTQLMTQRGVLFDNQWRYLEPTYHGALDMQVVPDDAGDRGATRGAVTYTHAQTFGPYLSGQADIEAVSDKQYFFDFGDSIAATS